MSPFAPLSAALAVAVLVLIGALVQVTRAGNHQATGTQATVVALRTEVAGQQAQAVAQQTEIAQQRRRIEQLQRLVAAQGTPTYQANGPHGYLASFQLGQYAYILYLQWVESDGFIHTGQLLTADNYARHGSRSFQLSGVDNNGTFGFTATEGKLTITFSGKINSDGTFTATGVPWSVFYGFVGGTFTQQKLRPATLQMYRDAVANLSSPPQ